ncbi:class I SAM-dependent methyltransferase [Persicirhabdus sediminis]|uniref:Class I SAM-dependent methyltransferase n=1 Tax=Persicirhabdus sediminis TaxID=454144 RepID=A0A8J7MCF2_9BACT|nr:class I SAM-dependent methyltransferase [Persicirhabdus sediminis]MBK1790538.1 class I SAM-dependent methyltransferase [Persicirhabdus sediminis]
MHHDELIAALKNWSQLALPYRARVLDLGSGDAHVAANAWSHESEVRYTGIDFSSSAGKIARERLEKIDWQVEMIDGDFLDKLDQLEGPYDVIVAGYTLHHLSGPEQLAVIARARQLLSPQGTLMVYDVVRRDQETRDEFNQRLLSHIDDDWKTFDDNELAAIRQHISREDYPQTKSWWQKSARLAGFGNWHLHFADERDFFYLIEMS